MNTAWVSIKIEVGQDPVKVTATNPNGAEFVTLVFPKQDEQNCLVQIPPEGEVTIRITQQVLR